MRDFVVGKFCLGLAGLTASFPATSAKASLSFSHSTHRCLSRSKKDFSDIFVILWAEGTEVGQPGIKVAWGKNRQSKSGGWPGPRRYGHRVSARTCLPFSRFPATCAFRAWNRSLATFSSISVLSVPGKVSGAGLDFRFRLLTGRDAGTECSLRFEA